MALGDHKVSLSGFDGEKRAVQGSSVEPVRNPPWAWDEIVLACELVRGNNWRELRTEDTAVIRLSGLLRSLPLHPFTARKENFRSPGSVSRKTADLATAHPDYSGKPTRGNRLDAEVVAAFLQRPSEMVRQAQRLREALMEPATATPDLDLGDAPADEGRLLERRHLGRERDPKLRRRKISAVVSSGSPVACEACGFNFAVVYGERGEGYIEVHHRVPLHVSGPTVTSLADLALLCSNCHRMVHRGRPWLTVEELRQGVEKAKVGIRESAPHDANKLA